MDHQEAEPEGSPQQPLDYWGLVALTRRNLSERFDDADVTANQAILSLNRAAGAITYDLESTIHRPRESSWAAYTVLFTLWNVGAQSPHRLAELTNMSRAAISNTAKNLCGKGLIKKRRDTHDGRSVTLRLTPEGEEFVNEVFQKQNRRERAWMSNLTEIEQQLFIQLLHKLMDEHSSPAHITRYSRERLDMTRDG